MKLLFAIAAFFLASCASRQVEPNLVTLEVEPIEQPCRASDMEIAVQINVRNSGRGPVRLWVDSIRPPYKISWLSYAVLDQAGNDDWRHGPGGHGSMPPSTLSIGSGDSTQLLAPIYDLGVTDHDKVFRIRFKDVSNNVYISPPFKPCIGSGA